MHPGSVGSTATDVEDGVERTIASASNSLAQPKSPCGWTLPVRPWALLENHVVLRAYYCGLDRNRRKEGHSPRTPIAHTWDTTVPTKFV
jgi:hypothetical protein